MKSECYRGIADAVGDGHGDAGEGGHGKNSGSAGCLIESQGNAEVYDAIMWYSG